jgi:hypothetical protein
MAILHVGRVLCRGGVTVGTTVCVVCVSAGDRFQDQRGSRDGQHRGGVGYALEVAPAQVGADRDDEVEHQADGGGDARRCVPEPDHQPARAGDLTRCQEREQA